MVMFVTCLMRKQSRTSQLGGKIKNGILQKNCLQIKDDFLDLRFQVVA